MINNFDIGEKVYAYTTKGLIVYSDIRQITLQGKRVVYKFYYGDEAYDENISFSKETLVRILNENREKEVNESVEQIISRYNKLLKELEEYQEDKC